MSPIHKYSLRKAFSAFFVVAFVIWILFIIHFLWTFEEELMGPISDLAVFAELIFFLTCSSLEYIIPAGLFVMTLVYFRTCANQNGLPFNFKSTILTVVFVGVICFVLAGFLFPKAHKHQLALLYSMALYDGSGEVEMIPMHYIEIHPDAMSFFQLRTEIDHTEKQLEKVSHEPESVPAADEYVAEIMRMQELIKAEKMKLVEGQLHVYRRKMANTIGYPFFTICLFSMGIFAGIGLRKFNIAWPLLGILFLILPILYYLDASFEMIARQLMSDPYLAKFLFLLIPTGLSILLWIVMRQTARHQTQEQDLNKAK